MVALVTGGGGRLGNVLVRALLEQGSEVRVLEPGRRPISLEALDIDFVSGSVLDAGDVARSMEGVDVVYHLAAKIDLRPKKDPMLFPINVDGTRAVAEACLSSGVRMVHTSSHHAVEREPLDQPLTEEKPLAIHEKCDYHRSKAIGETVILDSCRRGLDATIVNPLRVSPDVLNELHYNLLLCYTGKSRRSDPMHRLRRNARWSPPLPGCLRPSR